MDINKKILHLAVPAIITNITVPLLGLVDITIAGHLGNASFIGAMAVASMMFNLIYWNFTFLRMGTTGITAQAYGRKDNEIAATTFFRAALLAVTIGLSILILQYPLQLIALWIISPSEDVKMLAQTYFYICVWGAPAILLLTVIKAWFFGMQNARFPMYLSIGVNIINILISVCAVYLLNAGFRGIAFGTLIAEYCGALGAIFLLRKKYRYIINREQWKRCAIFKDLGVFFRVNRDIFLRSICMLGVTLFFMSVSARSGDLVLAANTLIMQLFILFSYFMDGFAFAGEALTGRFTGAADKIGLSTTIKHLFRWGAVVTFIFTLTYSVLLYPILQLLTNDQAVIQTALDYRFWCALIPLAGVSAFIWDGIFIGMTLTKQMVQSVFVACSLFFIIFYFFTFLPQNERLWSAFLIYLAMRGIMQLILFRSRKNS